MTGQAPDFTLTATLANGSARPWTALRLTLGAPGGWDLHALDPLTAPVLRAGDELTVRWRITPAQVTSDTTLACRATARHSGEDVTYLARTRLG